MLYEVVPDHLDDSWLTPDEIRAKRVQQQNPGSVVQHQQVNDQPENRFEPDVLIINQEQPDATDHSIGSVPRVIDASDNASSTQSTHSDPISIDAAREEVLQQRQRQSRSGRALRPNSRFFNRDFINYSSHDSAESFRHRRLRGFDLDYFQISQMSWGNSVYNLMQEAVTPNGDSRRFFATMDVLLGILCHWILMTFQPLVHQQSIS
jgi:hypothetical protein